MNYDDKFSHPWLKTEHLSSKYNNLIWNAKPWTANSVTESKRSRFAEYMDKVNASIQENDINKIHPQTTLNIERQARHSLDPAQMPNKRVSTAVSPYREEILFKKRIKPKMIRNQIWRSAGRRRLHGFSHYVPSKLYSLP